MESVIWVDFATLLNVEHGDVDIRDEIVYKLFSGDENKAAERQVFLSGAHETDRYYADLIGEGGIKLLDAVQSLKDSLFRFYVNLEATIAVGILDCTKLHGIHSEFRETWSECRKLLAVADISIDWDAQYISVKRK